ncbi:MAG: 23S rRNA (guanosine(2251)-2'-O)-methyltransferase RlmB, partial [Selenomonadaceae bacterium]|nr:23S rRNA (guanosine(2251)-2'-O)-methyltransferase RlmB [Selenomonadaceae bacterium]
LAYSSPVEYSTLDEIIQLANDRNELPFILLLDEIEDPHNFGAILRTADAVGVHGVLIPKRRSVSLNSTVAKTSAGAMEYVKVAQINNVAQTLKQLRDMNFVIIGSDAEGTEFYDNVDFNDAIVLVIGSEGKGMRRLTKENCDILVKIPMIGKINSLNASVASAVLMYEVFRQRRRL